MTAALVAAPLAANEGINGVALAVLILLFAVVTVLGFMATRFKKGDNLDSLDEWRLGRHLRGRQGEDGGDQRGDGKAQRRVHPR